MKPMSEAERAEIKASVQRAWVAISFDAIGLTRAHDRQSSLLKYEQDCLLAMLRHARHRTLKTDHARQTIESSRATNDLDFFKRLGRVLSEEPLADLATRLQKFLLEHWIEQKENLPELCRLSPEGLKTVCHVRINCPLDSGIVKERQRLRLLAFKRDKINAIEINKRLRFLDRSGSVLTF